MVALYSGQAIGQLLLRSGGGVAPHVSFEIASILISLAILPVCLTRSAAPTFAEAARSEEHTSELQSLMRISYAVFCLKKKKTILTHRSVSIINHNTKYN